MHRSGTSCLTGLLEDAGVYLGNVSKQNPYNKKGNQENPAIMRLHDEVLASNGGSWDHPPAKPVIWNEVQQAALTAILDEYKGHACWAFKDPRTMLTLPGWLQQLPSLRFVGTFRHPAAVAQSLHRRGQMPPEEGFGLWLHYNRLLLDYQREFGFEVLCFDLNPNDYLAAAVRAFDRLGLDTASAPLGFYDEELRSGSADPQFRNPPPEVTAVYARLRELAL
jgi:hypothetical protein